MPALYRVHLTPQERADLSALTRRGQASARQIARARTLLLADRGLRDPEIATATGQSARTVQRTRRRAVEAGVQAALVDRPAQVPARSSMDQRKRCWSPWPVPIRPPDAPPGRCNSWPTAWSNWPSSTPSPMRPCAAR
jgi:Homeodomain-like domain